MLKMKRMSIFFLILALLIAPAAWAGDDPAWLETGRKTLTRAMSQIGLSKADPNLLVLTNAGYGNVAGKSTEAFLDITMQETGCSPGARSFLPVHTGVREPLWCSVYRKDTGGLVFLKWTGKGFELQMIDASPANILTPDGWKEAGSGLIGGRLFSVASLCVTCAVDPPWALLTAALFHDHFCPGVNSGYMAGLYVLDKLPLRPGERYVFVTSPGKCAADALQVMLNTTAGKGSGYTMAIGGGSLAGYEKDGVRPLIIAMRVNSKADTCDGRVLGFNWNKAYRDTGVKADEMSPKGGPGNPIFWISRTKMSRELARLSKGEMLAYIKDFRAFSGNADLVDRIAGGDPYSVVWNR